MGFRQSAEQENKSVTAKPKRETKNQVWHREPPKCSAAGVLREIRRELDGARKPTPRSSFAKRLQLTGRDRRQRTGPKMRREPPRWKKHAAPQPPRLKVFSAEQKRQIEELNLREVAS